MTIWRRLFWLWLYGALAWVCTLSPVGRLLIINDPWINGGPKVEGYASTMLPVNCMEARGKSDVDYEMWGPAEPWNRDYPESFDMACWYGEKQFKALYPEYKNLPFAAVSVAQYDSLGWVKTGPGRYSDTKLAAFILFVPPLLLLLLGFLLRLAYSGLPPTTPNS